MEYQKTFINFLRLKVQQIDLMESMELQRQQLHRIKEAKIQNALDKLTTVGSLTTDLEDSPQKYEDNDEKDEDDEEEEFEENEDEVQDSDDD